MASDDPTLLVDHLANNYNLDADSRGELHAFSELARGLPELQCKIALVRHASLLQNHQSLEELKSMCAQMFDTVKSMRKSFSDNTKLSNDQKAEITAACRVVFFTGRLTDFDNDGLKPEVVSYLKKNMEINGFALFFEDKTQAHGKIIANHVGRSLSGVKTFFRRTFLKSLPLGNNEGIGLTALTATLVKKCLGGSENALAKHAIWCLIVRYFIRSDSELRASPVPADTTNDDNDDDTEQYPAVIPAKRTCTGTVKILTTDGKLIAAFWDRVSLLWKRANREHGTADLKSEKWTALLNTAVAEGRVLFPKDALALIVGSAGIVAPTTAPSTNRLSGLSTISNEAGGSRASLMPRASITRPPMVSFARTTFDNLLHTPSLTWNGVPVGSGSAPHIQLPPLNLNASPFQGNSRDEGARRQDVRSG
ncbi:hypothetical protein K438DRAFT_1866967 [Mycena galopus ATCC 62051]|nr:hypothetical protein K438DRAFT_1866967 [Mycena galopus ATCC 62051]